MTRRGRLLGLGLGILAVGTAARATSRTAGERGEVLRRVIPSAVQLRAERDGGARRAASGVVLASDSVRHLSWILTTRHFLEPVDRGQVSVSTPRTGRTSAPVLATSADSDLAVIELAGIALPPSGSRPPCASGTRCGWWRSPGSAGSPW